MENMSLAMLHAMASALNEKGTSNEVQPEYWERFEDAFTTEAGEFCESILEDKPIPLPLELGLKSLEIGWALQEALGFGKTVFFDKQGQSIEERHLTTANPQNSKPQEHYDYIILGGGTAGLVVANRLSANPSISVAVIEAGSSVYNNPNVTQTARYSPGIGTQIDWQYTSLPQKYALNETKDYSAGKALGGTSTINGMTYLRAQSVQIDAWQTLGNPGWNWSTLLPYYKKSEHFQIPDVVRLAKGAAFDPSAHGYSGPVDVGWQSTIIGGDVAAVVNQTWNELGMPYNVDANDGSMRGFSVWPFTLDAKTDFRADSARSYYYPVANRTNLHVFLDTNALRLTWKDCGDNGNGDLIADSVEVLSDRGEKMNLYADREVILSLGSLRTPAMLEYSGIGNPAILQKYSIPVRVNLPSVGENLQDQTNTYFVAPTLENFTGYPPYVSYPTAHDLFGANTSALKTDLLASIPKYAQQNALASTANATTPSIQEKLLHLQASLIFDKPTISAPPLAEILTAPFATTLTVPFWNLLPLSRGNVHIQSRSPASIPAINPNFFMASWDALVQVTVARYARQALTTPPLSAYLGPETVPGFATVPEDASDEEWLIWIKKAYTSNQHPIGTAAMMGREWGGVVDSELRVYGTGNVRVVDASVLPMQVSGHLSGTVYAVAERASDIIKARSWD